MIDNDIKIAYSKSIEKLSGNLNILEPLVKSLQLQNREAIIESMALALQKSISGVNAETFRTIRKNNIEQIVNGFLNVHSEYINSIMEAARNLDNTNILSVVQSISPVNLHNLTKIIPTGVYDDNLENENLGESSEFVVQKKNKKTKDNSKFMNMIKDKSVDEIENDILQALWKKCPQLACSLVILVILINVFVVLSGVKGIVNACRVAYEKSCIYIEGKENTYIVKTESAKMYSEPSSRATVITMLLYDDQVCKTEDIKNWIKVEYQTKDGQLLTGWIAKRNLMTYRTYQFHQNNLYK